MNMPIFFDDNTPRPFIDPTVPFNRTLWPEDASESSLYSSFPRKVPKRLLILTSAKMREMELRYQIISTWTRWASEWVAAVSRSPSKPVRYRKRGGCTMR